MKLAQGHYVVDVAEARVAQADIQCRCLVTRGPDNAVTVGPVGILGIVLSNVKVKRGDDVHDRKRAAGVARTCRAKLDKIVAAHHVGGIFQLFNRIIPNYFTGCGILKRHCLLLEILLCPFVEAFERLLQVFH